MDALTGFAITDGSALLDAMRSILSLVFMFAVWIFIAVCWFFIGRKAGVSNAWRAFVPVVGHFVSWRASRTPGWSLALVIVSSVLVPVASFVLFASFIIALVAAFGGASSGFSLPIVIVSFFVLVVFSILQFAIITWWTYRVARELGFSWWTGLLASPIAQLIPFGVIVRLVFLGILAFRREPL